MRTGGLIATPLLGAVLARRGAQLIGGFHQAMVASAIAAGFASITALLMLGTVKMRDA